MTGFNSKRQMVSESVHWSDCAVHNGPAYPAGECDCGAAQPWNEDEWRKNNWRCGHGWLRGEQCEICNAPQPAQEPVHSVQSNGRHSPLLTHMMNKRTPPPQRPWVGLTDEDCKGMNASDKVVAMWANRILKEKNT